mgnify:CR=1 FL=1
MIKKYKVKIEDVELVRYEGSSDLTKSCNKVGVLLSDFEDDAYELLEEILMNVEFKHEVDQQVYYWLTELEYKKAIDVVSNSSKLYPLDNGTFIYDMTNYNQPFEITLEELANK